jgi:hypothetical protein
MSKRSKDTSGQRRLFHIFDAGRDRLEPARRSRRAVILTPRQRGKLVRANRLLTENGRGRRRKGIHEPRGRKKPETPTRRRWACASSTGADSEAALALAVLLGEDTRGDTRWRLALLGMDLLLTDLGFDLDTRRAVVRAARDRFGAEHRVDAGFKHQLGQKFRPERRGLEALLDLNPGGNDRLGPGLETFRRRSARLAPVAAELRERGRSGRLSVPLAELAPSYLHMHANRLLRSAHRAQELVLYDFLDRLYESRVARRRPGGATGPDTGTLSASGGHS